MAKPSQLSIYLSIYPNAYLCIYLSVCLFVHLCSYLSICLSVCPSIRLSVCLSLNLFIYLSFYLFYLSYLFAYLAVYLPICKIENKAIVRECVELWQLKAEKRSFSARLPSNLEIDNITILQKILPDFNQKLKVECWAYSLIPMRFAIFPCHLSKLLRMPRKSEARSCEMMHLSRKIRQSKDRMLQNQPLWRNQRSDLLTCLMEMSLVLRLPRDMHLAHPLQTMPANAFEIATKPSRFAHFWQVHNPLRLPRETTSGPNMWEMCFAPQQCALFQHLNFQKCTDVGVVCTFSLRNVPRATMACTFSISNSKRARCF